MNNPWITLDPRISKSNVSTITSIQDAIVTVDNHRELTKAIAQTEFKRTWTSDIGSGSKENIKAVSSQ